MPLPDDLCPRPDRLPRLPTEPLVAPIYPAAVYRCDDPRQAAELLSGERFGYVYSRDGHPNADLLAEKCRELHAAERAAIAGTGMGALALAVLALLEQGDHVVVSQQLYGRSLQLFTSEWARLGVASSVVDTCDLPATAAAFSDRTKLVIVETITNPLLRVSDLAALAKMAHARGARLLVDNTFAGPIVCRPIELGADLVMESLTKSINGHSDVNLGLLGGRADCWERVPLVLSAWGLASGPFDCWLAARGLGTLALRAQRANANALAAARHIREQPQVEAVHYPGLPEHADHELARRQFEGRFGSMVTFTLRGGTAAAEQFIRAAEQIPFCPSLGDLSTTLSHPESTSHRGMTAEARAALGIFGGKIRLSVGIESPEAIQAALSQGFAGAARL
jgi:cystathionine beta-lyase/cystathionine gamma-synthase